MLFEIANGKYYNIAETDRTKSDYDIQPTYSQSPAGLGIGGDYDPNGGNAQGGLPADTNDGYLRYATGHMLNSDGHNFISKEGRHNGGANFLMADTHAKYFRPTAVSAGHEVNWSQTDYCGMSDDPGQSYEVAAEVACSDPHIAVTFSTK
jgi:prepilin-type processing-associated H-X9-DG protein